jgi:hypothetical protein
MVTTQTLRGKCLRMTVLLFSFNLG